jgi:dCTP deaminase
MPGIKPDEWIRQQVRMNGMIDPFEPEQVRSRPETKTIHGDAAKLISYGTSSYGYDMRVSTSFRIFTNVWDSVVDPKSMDEKAFVSRTTDKHIMIPPNSFALAVSVEKFKIPKDVLCVVLGKSTYARCGIIINVTPLEPGWEGHVTLEISNTTPLPAKIYANEGIAQVLFFQSDLPCKTSYADRAGKYQNQKQEIVLPKV